MTKEYIIALALAKLDNTTVERIFRDPSDRQDFYILREADINTLRAAVSHTGDGQCRIFYQQLLDKNELDASIAFMQGLDLLYPGNALDILGLDEE